MPAKTPIYLKTSTPKRGKKPKLRDMLSREMISPPLGDFRHSAHIGVHGEGDMFGELSFLQGKYDLLPSLGGKLSLKSIDADSDEGFHTRVNPGGYRPFLKTAVSLPAFGGAQNKEKAPPKPPRLHLEEAPSQRSMSVSYGDGSFRREEEMSFSSISQDEQSRFLEASMSSLDGSVSGSAGQSPGRDSGHTMDSQPHAENQSLPKSESLFGLELDLGPSILDEVLRIMDDYKA